jgi:hypothetical protein
MTGPHDRVARRVRDQGPYAQKVITESSGNNFNGVSEAGYAPDEERNANQPVEAGPAPAPAPRATELRQPGAL